MITLSKTTTKAAIGSTAIMKGNAGSPAAATANQPLIVQDKCSVMEEQQEVGEVQEVEVDKLAGEDAEEEPLVRRLQKGVTKEDNQ